MRDPETLVQIRVSHGSHATYERWRDLDASGAIGRIAGFSFEDQVNWFNGDAAVSITPMIVTALCTIREGGIRPDVLKSRA